jgi:ankyrin repeat protein
VRKALHALPKDIDDMYDQTMERILLHRQKDLALQTLMWISYAPRPLSIEEVQHAIAIDDLEPDDILITEDILTPSDVIAGACAGLIKIYKERGVIGLVHKTTQEYFDRKFAAHFPDAKVQLGISYYRYLSLLHGPLFEYEPMHKIMDSYKLLEYVALLVQGDDIVRGETDPRLLDLAVEVLTDPEKSPFIFRIFFYVWGRGSVRDHHSGGNPLEGFLATHCAALIGWESLLKRLMEDPTIDIDSKDFNGQTPLWWAALNGRDGVIKLLLESGKVDINSRNNGGTTPLWHAADRGREGAVKLLLENDKVDINLTDYKGRPPLWPPCTKGHIGVVELLLEKGVDDIDLASDVEHDGTALTAAAWIGHKAVVKLLLEKGGANVNAPSGCGTTALMWATEHGNDAIVTLLLEKGADIDVRNRRGETALMWAALNDQEVILKLLLEKGVTDINAVGRRTGTGYSGTALMWAVYAGNEAIFKLLLEEGADVNVRAKNGETALMWAVLQRSEAMVKLLLEKGIDDVNAEAKDGTTALSRATARGFDAIVKLLLENGATDVNADAEDGQSDAGSDWSGIEITYGGVFPCGHISRVTSTFHL